MTDVAVIGAGELGGSICHLLARRDSVATIRLIDARTSVAAGKALDIMQSAPIDGFATRVVADAQLVRGVRVDVIVIADRLEVGELEGHEELAWLGRLADDHRAAPIICAGADARELVERGVRELGIARSRLVGTAPEALAAAIRALVALEIDASPRDVALTVLGIPPSHIVVPWDEAAIGGLQAVRVLDDPSRRRVAARLTALWPPGHHTLAAAVVQAVDCVVGRSRYTISAFVAPDDSAGIRTRAVALPTRLDRGGIAAVTVPRLNARDTVALENAMML